MADPAAAAAPMTIDFLRARLLSERSVSRASKERADQLAARVAELEEQVRAVTAQRRQAEREAEEVLAVLQSQGFCGSLDSGSDNDADEDEPRDATVTGSHPRSSSHGDEGQEQEQPPMKGGAEEEKKEDPLSGTAAQKEQPGGLSWKGRCASPRKARQLRQRHRRSYVYILASEPDPSPKYRLGQSCRKNKRKELSSVAVLPESQKEQRNGPGCADDGRAKLDGEAAGGDDHRSSGDGGQYVVRYDNGGEMERVLEKQAELIGQHEAQEKAQTDWERQFNGSRTSPANKGDVEADCQASSQDKSRGENSDGGSSGHTNSVSSAIKAPSESSPSISKASDWSSSRFQDHEADDACRRRSGDVADVESVLQALQRARISLRQKLGRPLPPSQVTLALPAPGDEYRGNEDDLCSSNGSSSYRGSSPSRQEMLALPAPEGYLGHGYHDRDHASAYFSADGADACSSRPRQEFLALPSPGDDDGEGEMKIPVGSLGLFRLPTDSFPEDETLSRSNGHDVELGLGDADGHDAYRHDGAGVPVKQLYDPHGTYGRCSNVPPGSGFTAGGGASFLSGLPDDLREGRGRLAVANADLFMQRGGDYTVSNR